MEYFSMIATVAFINLIAAISPGPDFVMCVRNSLIYSRKVGIYTGIGISLGLVVHIFYSAVGIALIISKSAILFSIIKYLGAGYLAYMGISSILAKKSALNITEAHQIKEIPVFQAIKTGFLTNILNPKASIFFLGLFTLVIGSKTPAYILVIITAIIIVTAIVWFSIVAILFSQKRIKNYFQKTEKALNYILGGLLILLSIKIALI
jgi:RhtB (resistance to homoserine/threonine) family protein